MQLSKLFKRKYSRLDDERSTTKEDKLRHRAATAPESKQHIERLTNVAWRSLPNTQFGLFEELVQRKPTEFVLFLALPKKLRCRIWREAFPRNREIRLRVQYRQGDYKEIEFGIPPPVTYYVNKESRAETEKFYHFVTQETMFNVNLHLLHSSPACYCINPQLDNISVGFMSLWNEHYSLFFKSLLIKVPSFRKQVRSFEIVDVFQAPLLLNDKNGPMIKKFLAENLTRFHYLDEVRFILDRRENLDSSFVEMWKLRIQLAFEGEIRRYPHCSTPEIVVLSWNDREEEKFLNRTMI